jgi:hypothetical protein
VCALSKNGRELRQELDAGILVFFEVVITFLTSSINPVCKGFTNDGIETVTKILSGETL